MQLGTMLKAAGLAVVSSLAIGCGSIDIEQNLALVGDNLITVRLPDLQPPLNEVSTSVEGGVATTISVDLGDLFSLGGIPAGISVDDLNIAGEKIVIVPNVLETGRICLAQDPDNLGGGMALIRPFAGTLGITLALNTIIAVEDGINLAGLPNLEFAAVVEDEVPTSLAELLGMFLGGGGGGLEVTQTISDTLPEDVPLFGGAEIEATLTLASAETLPTSPNLEFCTGFVAP
ncbi:MAG: hypothetical protein ACQGVK_17105 [Myxococcota bacterium]